MADLLRRFATYYRPHRGLFALDFGSAVAAGLLVLQASHGGFRQNWARKSPKALIRFGTGSRFGRTKLMGLASCSHPGRIWTRRPARNSSATSHNSRSDMPIPAMHHVRNVSLLSVARSLDTATSCTSRPLRRAQLFLPSPGRRTAGKFAPQGLVGA